MADESKVSADRIEETVKEFRDAAKWFIGALGAIAAVVAAGLSLASLGSTEGWRLVGAGVGTITALAGIIVLLYQTLNVLIVEPVTLPALADLSPNDLEGLDETITAPAADVQTLASETVVKVREAYVAYAALLESPNDPDRVRAWEAADRSAKLWVAGARRTMARLKYERVRRAFVAVKASLWLKIGLILGGIFLAAWGLNASEPAENRIDVVLEQPSEVLVQFEPVDFNSDRVPEHAELLGEECVNSKLPHRAVALSATGTVYTIALLKSDECEAVVVSVGPEDAIVALPPSDS
jgi:hypothetical protein